MSTGAVERNKQTVQRLFEAFRAGDTDAFDALIVEGTLNTTRRSRTAVRP